METQERKGKKGRRKGTRKRGGRKRKGTNKKKKKERGRREGRKQERKETGKKGREDSRKKERNKDKETKIYETLRGHFAWSQERESEKCLLAKKMECDGAAVKMEDAQSERNPAKEQVLSVK